jgi:hypothetical protein
MVDEMLDQQAALRQFWGENMMDTVKAPARHDHAQREDHPRQCLHHNTRYQTFLELYLVKEVPF